MFIDWHELRRAEAKPPLLVDSRRRLQVCMAAFLAAVLLIFGRAVQLEVSQGAAFRAEAVKPLERRHALPGTRGRILAHDGAVLACDKPLLALAVHYRYLQEPPDARWLHLTARARLPKSLRKSAQHLAAEEARVQAERTELADRLAQLCGLSRQEWSARAHRIEARVERVAQNANRRQGTVKPPRAAEPTIAASWPQRLGQRVVDALNASLDDPVPPKITVAEELDYHVMVEEVPLAVVAKIESNPERYPAAKIVTRTRRQYPCGSLAAHVLGHLGRSESASEADEPLLRESAATSSSQRTAEPGDFVGRMGLERQYETLLRGRPGVAIEMADRAGRVLWTQCARKPGAGADLVLTLQGQLQRTAEELLDEAVQRAATSNAASSTADGASSSGSTPSQKAQAKQVEPAGGAIVIMDVHSGALRAAASAPRFDPNWFAGGAAQQVAALLRDAAHPLFDRVSRMAIAPGSVFKTLTAIALLQSAAIDPEEPLYCQGYLHHPDQRRCEVFVRHGVGHGEVNLSDALAKSCNVYFFRRGGQLGPGPLVDWAERFGLGRPTGIDLPGEAGGTLPTPEKIRALEGHAWRTGDTESLSIGQGSLQTTPLQMACMMAAVANGGQLVTPHLVERLGLPSQKEDGALFSPLFSHASASEGESASDLAQNSPVPFSPAPPRPIPGLKDQTLPIVREALRRVVCDPEGTAHGTVSLETVAMAGKTGTAETGGGRAPHAWFAGYVPADDPKLAVVVVLEHAGSGATAAGPVVKRLVLRMQQLGML